MINNDFKQLGTERLNVKILQIWDSFYMISLQVLTKKKKTVEGYIKINGPKPDIIWHIQVYSGIIQAYSEPCVTLVNSELWHIQNLGIFKTRGIFRTLVYSKL